MAPQFVAVAIFLSTPSARRATVRQIAYEVNSIHFYPRPPRGGRPCLSQRFYGSALYFYPRPPRGGRPVAYAMDAASRMISIHALREEGDD